VKTKYLMPNKEENMEHKAYVREVKLELINAEAAVIAAMETQAKNKAMDEIAIANARSDLVEARVALAKAKIQFSSPETIRLLHAENER